MEPVLSGIRRDVVLVNERQYRLAGQRCRGRASSAQLVQATLTAVSTDDGTFRFAALPPGRYELAVAADGFAKQTRRDIILEISATLTVDFELRIAALEDSVTVVARAPLVDVTTSASPTNFDRAFLDNVPTSRQLEDLVALVPGVVANAAFGASQGSNGLVLDGVDLTEPSEGSRWLRFNYNWIDQVQVVALGSNVEHGGFTGALTTGTLKAGGNQFSGLAEYWTTRSGWVAGNTSALSARLQQQFTPRTIDVLHDVSVQVGGPIRRNRLWFFSGLEYYEQQDRPAGFVGPGSTSQDDRRAIVKMTGAVGPSVRLEGFFVGGRNDLTRVGAGASTPMEATNVAAQPEHV